MKLYEVPRNTKVRILSSGEVIMFGHIDGMYSLCSDKNNNVCHFVAWTEVEIVDEDLSSP